MTTSRSLALFAAFGLLAGCSGLRQPMLPVSNAVLTSQTLRAAGTLVVRVRLERPEIAAHYVSPSTKGMTVDIVGPTNVKKTVGLTLTAKGCKSSLMSLVCTLVVPNLTACSSKKPCYSGTVKTYDAFAKGRIPHGAHELSADENFSFNIGNAPTTIPLVLQGIPKDVLFSPATSSTIAGNQRSGFIEPKCSAAVQKVNVVSLDADGNFIVGPGAPKIALRSSNPAQFGVARKAGNLFTLSPPKAPAYPFGNVRVTLTAKAVPSKNSGGRSVTKTTHIAYSGDICGVITEFPVPTASSNPFEVKTGPDGALWFTEENGNKIGRLTTSGSFKEFNVPTASGGPVGIAVGADRNLWFAEFNAAKVGRMTTGGTFMEFNVTASSAPLHLVQGPDKNIWFSELIGNKIGRITPSGSLTEFTIPSSNTQPRGITVGPDGNIWFVESALSQVGYANTGGTIKELPVSGTFKIGIASGPGGLLWIAQAGSNEVSGVTTGGMVTQQFVIPSAATFPSEITVGPDGALWVTEQSASRILRFTPEGVATEFPVPTAASHPFGITVGPDGAIWFAETTGNNVGRLR